RMHAVADHRQRVCNQANNDLCGGDEQVCCQRDDQHTPHLAAPGLSLQVLSSILTPLVCPSYHSYGGAASKARGVKKPGARWGWLRAVGEVGPVGLPAQPSDLPANLAAGEGCRVDIDVCVAGLHSLDQFIKRNICEDDVLFRNRSTCQLAAELTLD